MTVRPISETTCKLDMQVVAKSRSFATTLAFNTIRLARRHINKRVRDEMGKFAKRIAKDYKSTL